MMNNIFGDLKMHVKYRKMQKEARGEKEETTNVNLSNFAIIQFIIYYIKLSLLKFLFVFKFFWI